MTVFRKIHIVGKKKVGRERGPLVWSGSEFPLVAPAGVESFSWRIIYWFAITDPQKRVRFEGKTEVTDATDEEKRALADGAFEEHAFNIEWPADMKTDEAVQRLKVDYARRYEKRYGHVPPDLFASETNIIRTRETAKILLA